MHVLNCPDMHWISKYEPQVLDDIVGHECIVKRLRIMVKKRDVPHLIIIGPSGVGKRVSIRAMLKEMITSNEFEKYILHVDMSDDRSCKFIHKTVENFIRSKQDMSKCYRKIILVQKADSMSVAVQKEIKKVMVHYNGLCRFCFMFSDPQHIIEAIQSRCAMLHFSKIPIKIMIPRIRTICEKEEVVYTEPGLIALVKTSRGDIRRCVNNLQSLVYGHGKVTKKNVRLMYEHTPQETLDAIMNNIEYGNIRDAYRQTMAEVSNGFALIDMVNNIYTVAKERKMNMLKKIGMLQKIGRILTSHTDGSISNLAYMDLLIGLHEAVTGDDLLAPKDV